MLGKLKFLFPLLIIYHSVSAQKLSISDKRTIISNYNITLAKQQWDSVATYYDNKMASFLPPSKMESLWEQLARYYGEYSHYETADTATKKGDLVFVTKFHFKRGSLMEQINMNDTGLITGLWFLPLEDKSGYAEPNYSNKKLYYETDAEVVTGDYKMKGKLTVPNNAKKVPAVILAWGSGPNGMNEEIGGCQPFNDLAAGLASQGIAVLRFDKRTYKHSMDINAKGLPTIDDEYTYDIASALKLLKTKIYIDPKNIYLLGHSQGGMLLPYLLKNIKGFAGGISMAGAARPLGELIVEQMNYLAPDSILKTMEEKMMKEKAITQAMLSMSDTIKYNTDADLLPLGFPGSYWIHLNKIQPAIIAAKIKKPILFLQGESDYQVRMDDYNLFRLYNKSANHFFKSYPKLNHLFVEGETEALSQPSDYFKPGNIYEPVIMDIAKFIKTKQL
ncbi:MAG: alpha/beta hydrolase [Bacteroidota bacterium]|nr:alpha/beta hydrolase [Bacteroidota bacterium]